MHSEISKTRFKAQALKIMRQLEKSGEPIIITDHGKPKLIVRKYSEPVSDPLERLRGSVLRYESPLEPIADGDWEALA